MEKNRAKVTREVVGRKNHGMDDERDVNTQHYMVHKVVYGTRGRTADVL